MPLTTVHSPLVSGAAPAMNQKTDNRSVRVVRSFMHKGEATKVGRLVTLPARDAAEVVASNKAVYEDAPPAASKTARVVPPAPADET